jgi:hypothetical protein
MGPSIAPRRVDDRSGPWAANRRGEAASFQRTQVGGADDVAHLPHSGRSDDVRRYTVRAAHKQVRKPQASAFRLLSSRKSSFSCCAELTARMDRGLATVFVAVIVCLAALVVTLWRTLQRERRSAAWKKRLWQMCWDIQIVADLQGYIRDASPSFYRITGWFVR